MGTHEPKEAFHLQTNPYDYPSGGLKSGSRVPHVLQEVPEQDPHTSPSSMSLPYKGPSVSPISSTGGFLTPQLLIQTFFWATEP